MKNKNSILTIVFAICAAMALSSCLHKEAVSPRAQIFVEQQNHPYMIAPATAPPLFTFQENPDLNIYIRDVLDHNREIASLQKSAEAFSYTPDIIAAQKALHVQGGVSGARKNQDNALTKPSNNADITLNARWGADLWGKIADQRQAAYQISEKGNLNLEHAKRLIVAQAMQSWFSYWHAREQTRLLKQQHKNAQNIVESFEQCYQSGGCTFAEYQAQKNAQRQRRNDLSAAKMHIKKRLHRLNILRGQNPSSNFPVSKSNITPVFLTLPETIPATALADRPDILAAFKDIEALDAQTRAAHKAMLPQLEITGAALKSSATLAESFGAPILWQLVGGLAQPILNGGALRLRARQKSTEAEAALLRYESLVLTAMEEAQNALASENAAIQILRTQTKSFNEAERSYQSAKSQYQTGQIDLAAYLENTDMLYAEESKWITAQFDVASARVKLALALGAPLYPYEKEGS